MKSNKIYFFLVSVILIAITSWITSCRHTADISGLPEICFVRDVLPIYTSNCAITGCHDGSREARSLVTYSDIRNSVVPYKPDKSWSYNAIISSRGEGMMPPGQVLSQELRTIIRVWIEQGANETTCSAQASIKGSGLEKSDNIR